MTVHQRPALFFVFAFVILSGGQAASADGETAPTYDGMPSGKRDYAAFVELWDDFLYWRDPKSARKEQSLVDVAGLETDVYPDFGA